MVQRLVYLTVCLALFVSAGGVLAQPLFENSGFELGNLNNWTQTVGTAWRTATTGEFGAFFTNAPEGAHLASTFFPPGTILESEQATIKSINFTVPAGEDLVEFYIAGWADPFIHVDFKKASDDSVVFTQTVPGTSASFVRVTIDGFSAYAGQELYIECVDENLAGDPFAASGWLGVDGFGWTEPPPPCVPTVGRPFENADFEMGDFTNWTVEGDAWVTSSATFPSDGWQCYYLASSFAGPSGELGLGSLTSIPFTMSGTLVKFKIGGWRETPGNGENWTYVTLHRASDNSVLDTVFAPNITGTMSTEYLDGSAAQGQQVYIKVTDDAANAGFAWMTVDDFAVIEGLPPCDLYPDQAFPGADFETGDLTGWTVDGEAFSAGLNLWPSSGFHCNYVCSSFFTGEMGTGSIQSPPFNLTKSGVSFKVGGWRGTPEAGFSEEWTYVTLHRASDNAELDRVLAPNITGVMRTEMLDGSAAVGENVYVKVTDDAAAGGFAWISVDAFRIVDYFAPEKRTWPVSITKVTTPPTIDGNINVGAGQEWSNALPVVDMRLSTLTAVDPYDPTIQHDGGVVPAAAPNGGTIDSDADASGLYYFSYDDTALYIAANITDSQIHPNVVAKAMNGGDAFQICLDYDLSKSTNASASGEVVIPTVAAAANTGTATTEDFSTNFSAFWPTTAPNPMTGTQWGVTVADGVGYKVELAIPWTAFTAGGGTFTQPFPPVIGQKMGMLLLIDDHDGAAGQGITFMLSAGGGANIFDQPGTAIISRADMYPEATFVGPLSVGDWALY